MRTFLCLNKRPKIRWGMLPDNTYFKGKVPKGYSLAVSPSKGYIVVDVDRHGKIDGFDNIPKKIKKELDKTFNYKTKNNGKHYWFKYNGLLANKTSGLGIDLRTHKGYVIWYSNIKLKKAIPLIKKSSSVMNKWLEKLFSYN